MKAFIPAAGLGTRLKPWTDHHPKALVPVGDKPMLENVVEKLHDCGISDITINVHHFGSQITDFIGSKGWDIKVSDESEELLETGGALIKAYDLLTQNDEPVLIHNADILSNVDLRRLEARLGEEGSDAVLLVSDRESSRKLVFDKDMNLKGWHSLKENKYRPEGLELEATDRELAFSGIYVIAKSLLDYMKNAGWKGKFSIIDFFLATIGGGGKRYVGVEQEGLEILDIGKPDALHQAQEWVKELQKGRGLN